jgi:ADP-ribosyl-[dinitrogen reductase] hydrolase
VKLVGECKVSANLRAAQELLSSDFPVDLALKRIGTSGWVVHTVAAAAYCFLKTPFDFERSVIDAVMGGDDADSTGAMTGAFSGAFNGDGAIPSRWRDRVERAEEIRELAEGIWDLASSGDIS